MRIQKLLTPKFMLSTLMCFHSLLFSLTLKKNSLHFLREKDNPEIQCLGSSLVMNGSVHGVWQADTSLRLNHQAGFTKWQDPGINYWGVLEAYIGSYCDFLSHLLLGASERGYESPYSADAHLTFHLIFSVSLICLCWPDNNTFTALYQTRLLVLLLGF